MTAYDRTLAIISTIVKTIISAGLSLIAGLIVALGIFKEDQIVLGWIVGLTVFWLICPGDTKNWIKNWTKPQLTKDK